MREISHQVFGALSSQISEEGLDLLLEPLTAPENIQGQKELFNTEDDDVVVDGDEEDEEEDDDVEVVDIEDASDVEIGSDTQFVSLNGQGEDDEDDSESESEDDEDEEATAADKEMQELDAAIGNILKSHRLDKDADAESSDNDEDMSDSEMLALDEKLTEVFKQRTKARPDSTKDKRQAKRTVVDFKNRILDLLEIYVRNEVGNPLALNLLLPLLRLIRTTKEKQLATRAHGVIAEFKRAGKKAKGGKKDKENGNHVASKSAAASKVDTEKLMGLLAEIHEEARKEAGNSHVTAASTAALKVVTAIMAADREMHERIIALYSKTLAAWPHCKGRTQFQHYWNSWVPPKA
jgi:DNA polymerase phi